MTFFFITAGDRQEQGVREVRTDASAGHQPVRVVRDGRDGDCRGLPPAGLPEP